MATVESVRGPAELSQPARGVTQEQIEVMMVENPVRYVTPGGAA